MRTNNSGCWCRVMFFYSYVPAWCGWVCDLCTSAHTLAWSGAAAAPPQNPQGPTHTPDGPAVASRTLGRGLLYSNQTQKVEINENSFSNKHSNLGYALNSSMFWFVWSGVKQKTGRKKNTQKNPPKNNRFCDVIFSDMIYRKGYIQKQSSVINELTVCIITV